MLESNNEEEFQLPHFINGEHNAEYHPTEKMHGIAYAVIRTDMPGRKLNHLPQLKEFLSDDINQYDDLLLEWTGGEPKLMFYDRNGLQVEQTIRLAKYSRDGIHELLASKGFKRNFH